MDVSSRSFYLGIIGFTIVILALFMVPLIFLDRAPEKSGRFTCTVHETKTVPYVVVIIDNLECMEYVVLNTSSGAVMLSKKPYLPESYRALETKRQ